MKKNIISYILAVLFVLGTAFSAQNFTISTNALSDTLEFNENSQSVFSITNTGNNNMTFQIQASNAGNIVISPNVSSLQIQSSQTKFVTLNYTSGSTEGTFTSEIDVIDSQNTSNNETISLDITVEDTTPTTNNPELTFFDNNGENKVNVLELDGEVDDEAFKRFILRNTGNYTLEDVEFSISDLDGGNDDINDNDVFFNGDDESNFQINQLNVGEEIEIEIEIEIPSNIEAETYEGEVEISATYNGGVTYQREYDIEVDVSSDEEEILFRNFNPVRVFGESGETTDEYEFIIENDGNNDVDDLELEVEEDLEEETSGASIPANAISFSNTRFDIRDGDEESIEFEIDIPENQAQGTYTTQINVLNSQGDELDSITLELRVTGDIYIEEITFPETINPGDSFEVEISLTNQGSKLYRDVKIDGYIYDIDSARSNLDESTSTFLMNAGDDMVKTLRFNIPDDALDGTKTLELILSYDSSQTSEIETIDVERPAYKMEITSNNINPRIAKCDSSIYTFLTVQNLGKFDERIKITSTIQGISIRAETNLIEISSDETIDQTLTLPIDTLEPGSYTVVQSVEGDQTTSEEITLRIDACSTTGGIDVDTNGTQNQNQTGGDQENENTVSFFGQEVERTTAVLTSALAGIVLLIVVSLFFL